MYRRTLLSLPLTTLLLSGCSRSRRQNEVLTGYLKAFIEGELRLVQRTGYGTWLTEQLVVESRVSGISSLIGWKSVEEIRKSLSHVQTSAADDLLAHRNDATPVQLDGSLLPASTRVDYISRECLQALLKKKPPQDGVWHVIEETYPGAGGVVSFSPIGFSLDGEQAVFGVGFSCGPVCGNGVGVLMRKRAAGWTVDQQRDLWIS